MVYLEDIVKGLSKENLHVGIWYDENLDQFMINLESMAKSHMHLYENGILRGRYDYEKKIDFNKNIDDIIFELANEFNHALHGRSYGNNDWFILCDKLGVKCKIYM